MMRLVLFALLSMNIWIGPAHAVSPYGADFNGDGYGDLVVAAPYEDVGGEAYAGAVYAFYGSAGGITFTGAQRWHAGSPGIEGVAELNGYYGKVLATGDFDGDGYSDLAIGMPWTTVGGDFAAGSVHVLYGSWSGLTAKGNQVWHQDTPGVSSTTEAFDNFGHSLAAGDFNNDGYADLAIGAPREGIIVVEKAGAINVLYGSPKGLSASGEQFWHQDIAKVVGTADAGDMFGFGLTAGDFNCDGFADLAASVPHEDVAGKTGAGAVNVLYGSAGGLWEIGNQQWSQGSPGIKGAPEDKDHFGGDPSTDWIWRDHLASGDFNRDGCADLAIGVRWESVQEVESAGAVNVIYGSVGAGLTPTGNQIWHLDTPGVEGAAQEFGLFGAPLAAADFDGDGADDLAIGAPFQEPAGVYNGGSVNVLRGSAETGLTTKGNQLWHQDVAGVSDAAEANEHFGIALAVGDFDGNGQYDLAVGVPSEKIKNELDQVGAMHIFYGELYDGLSTNGDQIWTRSGFPGNHSSGGFGSSAAGS